MLMAASIAGMLAVSATAMMGSAQAATGELENCAGLNACKGMGACGGKGVSCAGKNACKGTGWNQVAKGECVKMGGKLA